MNRNLFRVLAVLLVSLLGTFATQSANGDDTRVVFVPGRPSHGYGAHEHRAGCLLLADQLNRADIGVKAIVTEGYGYPEDPSVFDDADVIVVYCDGAGGHLLNRHLKDFDEIMRRGVGLVCLHFAVETPRGEPGQHFLRWIGGYFESHYSVNPHWTAEYETLPDHPIARGLKTFAINDEWYYHMRFTEDGKGVTPILTDLPPESTLRRGDGERSGNPHVREAVLERKEPQVTAWAYERGEDYNHGRGFGFTGGHFHWNWGHDMQRRVVLNAIVWAGKGTIPDGGVPLSPVTAEDLAANQDEDMPERFNLGDIRARIADWNKQ